MCPDSKNISLEVLTMPPSGSLPLRREKSKSKSKSRERKGKILVVSRGGDVDVGVQVPVSSVLLKFLQKNHCALLSF